MLSSALFVLQELHARGHKLYLVSRREQNRENLVKRLGIEKYFSDIALFSEKNEEVFKKFMDRNEIEKNGAIIVGDLAREEIAIGNALGMKTIWFRNGKFANELPRSKKEEPTFRITNLEEILTIVP